jgi:cytochrome c2
VLTRSSYLLRALDGYTKPASGEVLMGKGGWIAFADAALSDADAEPFVPRFEPIDRRQIDPAPFYMVWTGIEAADAHTKPWPYQLAVIEITSLERAFARAAPSGLDRDSAAWRGFERFVNECIACHAINGEGGRVGPELNVPRSIVEYRDEAQLKAFIRDPSSFRYTSMPAHKHLDERDLDDLIAYFRAMSERKDDPAHRAGAAHE